MSWTAPRGNCGRRNAQLRSPLTEFELIEKYFARLTPDGRGVALGVGDDAAVLAAAPGSQLVVTTDTLVAGVHYFPDAEPAAIGYKALAVNLSDLAAMGAAPCWFTLALTLSTTELTHTWLDGFSAGLAQLAREHAITLVGGDLCQGPPAITICALGECPQGQALWRSGATAGDLIYVSGPLGGAAWALAQLKSGLDPDPACLTRLLRPLPRVALGRSLRGIASAVIDISDGLLADLGHLLNASDVGARLDIDAIPYHESLDNKCDSTQKWRHLLSGGDDYELCFTVPPDRAQALAPLGQPHYRIGAITAQQGLRCRHRDGSEYIAQATGYRHF